MIVANITASGVDQRLRRSVVGFGLILAALVAMVSLGAPGWTVVFLFVPLFFVSNVAYQGLFKTWMWMAAHGLRDMGEGHEKVASQVELADLKQRSRRIMSWSIATAGALTAMALAAVLA